MKKVVIGLIVVVLILGVAVWQLYANLDQIVASVIEDAGSEVTATAVDVNGVQLKLLDGQATVSGLSVANPAGFSQPDIFKLDKIAVSIDVESLKGSPIIVKELVIRQPQVFLEINKNGVSNLSVLKRNVAAYTSGAGRAAGSDAPAQQAVKLIIRKLRFEGGRLRAVNALIPDRKIDTALPAFQLENIGSAGNGATGAQIAREVVNGLIGQATAAAARAGVEKLKDAAGQKGRAVLEEKLDGALKGVLGD